MLHNDVVSNLLEIFSSLLHSCGESCEREGFGAVTDEGVLPLVPLLFLPSECPDCIGTSSSLSLLRLCPTARKSVSQPVAPFNGGARSRAEEEGDESRFQA